MVFQTETACIVAEFHLESAYLFEDLKVNKRLDDDAYCKIFPQFVETHPQDRLVGVDLHHLPTAVGCENSDSAHFANDFNYFTRFSIKRFADESMFLYSER